MPPRRRADITDLLVQGILYATGALISALLLWRLPRNAIGWLMWVAAASYFLQQFAAEYAVLALIRQPGTSPLGGAPQLLSGAAPAPPSPRDG